MQANPLPNTAIRPGLDPFVFGSKDRGAALGADGTHHVVIRVGRTVIQVWPGPAGIPIFVSRLRYARKPGEKPFYASGRSAPAVRRICIPLNAPNMEIPRKVSPFPVGDKLPEQFSKFFSGQAWLAPLTHASALDVPVSNVTFSPGCRNNWHSHAGGQLLIAVGGRGYWQARGEQARELLPGDIVEIAPDVVHWPEQPPTTGSRTWPSSAIPGRTSIRGLNRSMIDSMLPRRLYGERRRIGC